MHEFFMPLQVLAQLRRLVAQIEDKSMEKLIVWSYLQRHISKQLKIAAPPATSEMGDDVVNSLCLCEFLSNYDV